MKRLINKLTFALLIFSMLLSLGACINSKRKQEKIKDTFSSFDNAHDYVFVTHSPNCLYIGENVIDMDQLTWQGRKCAYIGTATDCAYFFTHCEQSDSEIELLCFSYQTLELSLVTTIEAQNNVLDADYYHGEIYFTVKATSDEDGGSYLIYNPLTQENRIEGAGAVSSDMFRDFVTDEYIIINDSNKNKARIINKQTGEEKAVGYPLLKTCEQGKKIYALGDVYLCNGPMDAYEKNGEIYLVYIYLVDGFLGYPCYAYVMKYDFDSHTMAYYTSVYMENFPEGGLRHFVIPE